MAKQTTTYVISGRVFDRNSGKPVAAAKVEAWDKDLICDDLLGSAITTAKGEFSLEFTASYFSELFLDRRPELFFKVFVADELVLDTRHDVLWNVDAGNTRVELPIAAGHGHDRPPQQSTDQPSPRPAWSPSHSYLLGTGSVRAVVTAEKPDIDGFLAAANMDTQENRARIDQGMQKVQAWLDAEPGRKARFEASPHATLLEIDPKLPEDLAPAGALGSCARLQSGAYNPCALDLLRRACVWLGASATNRQLFADDPTLAIDAVAGAAPSEAIAVAKMALQYARRAL
jgi:hypothetical protein